MPGVCGPLLTTLCSLKCLVSRQLREGKGQPIFVTLPRPHLGWGPGRRPPRVLPSQSPPTQAEAHPLSSSTGPAKPRS